MEGRGAMVCFFIMVVKDAREIRDRDADVVPVLLSYRHTISDRRQIWLARRSSFDVFSSPMTHGESEESIPSHLFRESDGPSSTLPPPENLSHNWTSGFHKCCAL
jgi:hypothetical protein